MKTSMVSLAGLTLACLCAGSMSAGIGPVSEYYLVSGDDNQIYVLQGGNINISWGTAYGFEYPIAVGPTIRTIGGFGGGGGEYTLAGVPTGNRYASPGFSTFDSTTDGQNNYLVDWEGGGVYMTNADYSDPTFMFSAPSHNWLGITYDPTNDSLWLSAFFGGDVVNVDMAGNVLSSFNTGIFGSQAALALDHADGSLWLVEYGQQGDFFQYDKSGNLLSTAHYDGLVGVNPLGGEFAIPAPGAIALLGIAGLLAPRRRRR